MMHGQRLHIEIGPILGLLPENSGKLLPVAQRVQNDLLRDPVEEHLAGTGCLTASTSAQDDSVKLRLAPCPGTGRAGADAGAAADAPLRVIDHAGHANDAEIAQMRLIAVIGTACNIDLNMIVTRENDRLDLPGKLIGIAVGADAVVIADTCRDISGADGRIAAFRVPWLRLVGYRVHIHITKLLIHLPDLFQIL